MVFEPSRSTMVRPTAVAGLFYPADADVLSQTVSELLAEVHAEPPQPPKAIIAPHAGYVYSGPIAASAYALLANARQRIRRVVLLGPTHRVAVRGLAVPSVTHFASPLGHVELDLEAIFAARQLPQVVVNDDAHAQEHSLEVHVPFLQALLEDFRLVPFAVGDVAPERVAEVLDLLWGGPETLIVVSSDLSHYLSYARAQRIDRATCEAVLALRSDLDHEQACGATPVSGLTVAARTRKLTPALLDLRNSGDTAGDRSRVVGYASFAFYEGD